jgi:hypothetical protein
MKAGAKCTVHVENRTLDERGFHLRQSGLNGRQASGAATNNCMQFFQNCRR